MADGSNVILTEYKPPSPSTHHPSTFDADRYLRFFEHPWLSDQAKKFLFGERMLDARVVNWCRLSSWKDCQGVNWLQIPYYDCDWKLIGIQNRNLMASPPALPSREGATNAPRFKFPYGSQCSIYNLPVLKMLRPGESLYIAEGCSDCWSLLSAGHKAIAIPSATLLKPKDVETIIQHLPSSVQLHMYPDQDEPGERLFMQLGDLLSRSGGVALIHHHLPPDCKDFSDYYVSQKMNTKIF